MCLFLGGYRHWHSKCPCYGFTLAAEGVFGSRGGGSGSAGAAGVDLRVVAQSDYLHLKTIYSKPSVARTLMARLLRLFETRS